MSYRLFKAELLSNLTPGHGSKTRQASTIANAYGRLVSRHFEVLTGGGRVVTAQSRTPILRAGLQAVFTANRLYGRVPLNIFTQMSPAFYAYWGGQTIVGPLGTATVLFPGLFRGPRLNPSDDVESWINIFCAVAAAHIMTLGGIYRNNFPVPIITPWSGVMMLACPIIN